MNKKCYFRVFSLALMLVFLLSGCGMNSLAQNDVPTVIPESLGTISSEEPSELPDGELRIQFIDVGQADATLIECDGEYMLVDGGNAPDSNIIYSILERNGINHLKYVIGTHAHEDHIGGLPGAFRYATADWVFCPVTNYDTKAFQNFKAGADDNGGIFIPGVGDTYSLGGASFQILGVNSVPDDTNNTSIVFMLTYGETKFLFMGDAEREAEAVILDAGFDLSADVLKIGHHGSSTSSSYPFLREVMPTYGIISCETGNSYGHPHDETLSKMRDAGVQLYRTDLQGDIFCVSDGKNIEFTTQKTALEDVNPTENERTPNTPTMTEDDVLYIGNKNSFKVHIDNCDSLPAEHNRVYFDTLEDALDAGYTPCGKCLH